MAEITNGCQGGAHLAVRIEVLRSGESPGPVVRGGMFTFGSGEDMVWLRVTYYVAERAIFSHEVQVQAGSVGMWVPMLEGLMAQTIETDTAYFGMESPELGLTVKRHDLREWKSTPVEEGPDFSYDLLVLIDTAMGAEGGFVSSAGPAMFLYPQADDLLKFAHELRDEMLAVRAREGIQDDVSQWKLNDDPNWLEHFFEGFVCSRPAINPPAASDT
jgi:hypothetical protein